MPQSGLRAALIAAEHAGIDNDGMGVDMRTLHLFVVLIGAMPALAFGATVWLTDGAPFRPFGRHGVPMAGERNGVTAVPRETELGRRPTEPTRDVGAIAAISDPEWDRLNRLARDGDRGAALLLTILEDPGNSVGGTRR